MKGVINKSGQVWVETVIYTLIAFSLIAAVLTFVKPKIEEIQDNAVIIQSIQMLKAIDNTITNVANLPAGNRKSIEINVNDGTLKFDGENDRIEFLLKSKNEYSEPGVIIQDGEISIKTTLLGGKDYEILLSKNYTNYNITTSSNDVPKTLSKSTTTYNVLISNAGSSSGSKLNINIEVK